MNGAMAECGRRKTTKPQETKGTPNVSECELLLASVLHSYFWR